MGNNEDMYEIAVRDAMSRLEDVLDCNLMLLVTVKIKGEDEQFMLVLAKGAKFAYSVKISDVIKFLIASKIIKEDSLKIKSKNDMVV